jgi:hypothetical protein
MKILALVEALNGRFDDHHGEAEFGLDMRRFPTAERLASWAKLSAQTV